MANDVMQLSEDQVEAIAAVRAWWATDRQTFSLAGYAGTGKTTVISRLLADWPDPVVVAAPTGKAALRLRQKGVRASTIHQLAYRYVGTGADGEMEFDYTGIKCGKALVVIDEASMVNQRIYDDLIAGGYRMLFVGDHGQLAPVGGDPGIMRNPDFALSVIHRQDDRGLLAFAHALREGVYLPEASGAVAKHWLHPMRDAVDKGRQEMIAADVVLCYQNRTRHQLNARLMNQLGMVDAAGFRAESVGTGAILYDLVGKTVRVVGLRNDYKIGLFNGQIMDMVIERVAPDYAIGDLVLDTGDRLGGVTIATAGFGVTKPPSDEIPNGIALLDFGYALTAHKSQGSEWPHVCMFDDTFAGMGMDDRARLCYTAATRAKHRLTWLHR